MADFCHVGSKYEEELSKLIDKDQLPTEYGGTAVHEVRCFVQHSK
jgi:hypothetical protein